MNIEEYHKLVKKHTPSEEKLKNALLAFITGAIIGLVSSIVYKILLDNNFKQQDATSIILIALIGIASILTGLSFFDNLVSKLRCGLIIPITGFAHSITSSAIEFKKDGLITGLGSNVFKLAGSVLLYGVISAFILTVIKIIISG